jgi:hypothetical protein
MTPAQSQHLTDAEWSEDDQSDDRFGGLGKKFDELAGMDLSLPDKHPMSGPSQFDPWVLS